MKNRAAKIVIKHILDGDINSAILLNKDGRTIELTNKGELLIETGNGYSRTWCNTRDIEDEIQKLINAKIIDTICLLREIKFSDLLD